MRFLLRRLGFYLAALWAAVTLNFFIPRLIPGDPVEAYIIRLQRNGQVIPPNIVNAIRAQFGISNDPIWVQYFQYLNNLIHGNLGIAISQFPTKVTDVLAADLPWTLGLVGMATVMSFVLGTLLGAIVAWKRGSAIDTIFTPLLTFFSAIPYFWLALGLVYVIAFTLSWLPLGGGYDILGNLTMGWNLPFILSVMQHALLPAITIVIGSIGGWVLGMRNTMIMTLSEDYVQMARAKGLSEGRVMLSYAARNAILPSITGFGMSLGFVVGGSLVTEIIFTYPGIGFALFNAITAQDYSLIEAIFLIIAVTMLVANFLSEIVYMLLDPRVRQGRG